MSPVKSRRGRGGRFKESEGVVRSLEKLSVTAAIAADVRRQREVAPRVGADQIRRHAQAPESADPNASTIFGQVFVAAHHLIEENARGFCEIDGLRQREGRDVLDLAVRIPWRQAEIVDDCVVWISRIHLAAAANSFKIIKWLP